MNKIIEQAANSVLEDLTDRRGFDSWWHDIDDDIKNEIKEAIGIKFIQALTDADWNPVILKDTHEWTSRIAAEAKAKQRLREILNEDNE